MSFENCKGDVCYLNDGGKGGGGKVLEFIGKKKNKKKPKPSPYQFKVPYSNSY